MARTRRAAETPTVDGNVTKADFVQHFDNITEKLRLKKEADSALATAYKAAERNGIDRKMLKQVRGEADLTSEERAINERRRRLYLEWLGRPVGFQAEMEVPEGEEAAPNGHAPDAADEAHARTEAYEWGISAGKAGAAVESILSKYQPGTAEHQEASSGWAEGQRNAVESLGGATHVAEGRA